MKHQALIAPVAGILGLLVVNCTDIPQKNVFEEEAVLTAIIDMQNREIVRLVEESNSIETEYALLEGKKEYIEDQLKHYKKCEVCVSLNRLKKQIEKAKDGIMCPAPSLPYQDLQTKADKLEESTEHTCCYRGSSISSSGGSVANLIERVSDRVRRQNICRAKQHEQPRHPHEFCDHHCRHCCR